MENQYKMEKYKIAIEARDKLNDNYHKWMTFYYVANGAILVAITTLSSKQGSADKGIFILSLIGVLICMIWNLSCKGYYYWSNSWIHLIIESEKKLFGNDDDLVYGKFSKTVAQNEKYSWYPLQPNNISTPKLTLLFSFISFLSWIIYSIYSFNIQFEISSSLTKTIISILIFLIIIVCYIILPRFVKSRKEDIHKLV